MGAGAKRASPQGVKGRAWFRFWEASKLARVPFFLNVRNNIVLRVFMLLRTMCPGTLLDIKARHALGGGSIRGLELRSRGTPVSASSGRVTPCPKSSSPVGTLAIDY